MPVRNSPNLTVDDILHAAKGESGKGIKSTDVEYAISVSNVIAPVDGWQTTSPEWEVGADLQCAGAAQGLGGDHAAGFDQGLSLIHI